MRACPAGNGKGACACSHGQVTNIRLRPPPQVDIGACRSERRASPFWGMYMSDIDDLERLHVLHVSGALTEIEYADRKARLLSADDRKTDADVPRERRRYWPFIALLGFLAFVIIALLASGTVAVEKTGDGGQQLQNLAGPGIATEDAGALGSQPQSSTAPSSKAITIEPDETEFRHAEWPSIAGLSPSLLSRYPAGPFTSPNAAPKLTVDQTEFRDFRSTFVSEAKLGPNFNGHYRVIFVGCGTHCTFNFILDEANGRISPLVVNGDGGGEESLVQDFRYYSGSSLMAVAAGNADKANECIYSIYNWRGGKLEPISQRAVQLPNGEENFLGGCNR